MYRLGLLVGLLVFLVVPVYATHDTDIVITEVSVLGCGNGTPVYFAGTTNYGADPYVKCTTLYYKPEGQSFFNQPYMVRWCDRRTTWNYTKTFNVGDYVVRAMVSDDQGFNKETVDMTFSVPACTCP